KRQERSTCRSPDHDDRRSRRHVGDARPGQPRATSGLTMEPPPPGTTAARWDATYRSGRPPWDIGRPQPAFVRLADAGEIAEPVLDCGCGTGEHALMIAERGMEVVGVDFAPAAIDEARRKAAERGLSVDFQVADALDL